MLVLVLAVLMVSYASSLRAYLQQRAKLSQLSAQITERQAAIQDLELAKQRWADPAFVKGQARARFGYVAPGERSYTVLGADGLPVEGEAALTDPRTVLRQTPTAWWDTAWESVEVAGDPPRLGRPPANEIDGSDQDPDAADPSDAG